jgi:1,4-dihydroxy-2-naphthoate octaprenyltransferase
MYRGLHALTLLAVLLVFGMSFELLRRVIGITSPWLVLLLMFYFLGLAKVAEPLFKLRMPRGLRPLRPWELEGAVYRRCRVLEFGRMLRRTPLRYLNAAVYIDGQRRDSLQVRLRTESAEATHFWAAVLLLPYIALAGLSGRWKVVAWFSLAQLLVNVYPILHLRYVRGRLDRALRRSQFTHADFTIVKSGA